eukprot:Hpha_TRINITY_DN32468_c0_g1::TRINITY_DN32468_c0_g1_i1::g.30791::m.30791/K07507/mgtC; putative Mg2+ transporter-C (MgtC) family protein
MARCRDFFESHLIDTDPSQIAFYTFSILGICVAAVVALVVEPLLGSAGCDPSALPPMPHLPNDFADPDPCHYHRQKHLLYFTPDECQWMRRIMLAALLGAAIGYERRSPDRPAGMRTMMCVSTAAALFTVNAQLAFELGPMAWDGARVSAALPAGVGFLGAGLIWKETLKDGVSVQKVNGLTTAACIWLAAATGLAAGGGMWFSAAFTTFGTTNLLRFCPKVVGGREEEEAEEEEEKEPIGAQTGLIQKTKSSKSFRKANYGAS